MTSKARAVARAARESAAAEAAASRRRRARRARIRAALTAPFVLIAHPGRWGRTGHTGRIRRRRTRAERVRMAAVLTGLALLLVVVFVNVDAWPVRIGAVLLAMLLAPVLVVLSAPASRSVSR